MVSGQLRVAVIGAQTRHADSSLAYTVYRTAVNYRGLCYHRLVRYRHFLAFAKKLKLAPKEEPISVKLPGRIWWSRKASMKEETVEARQVLLNEFMQEVCARRLTARSEERLMKLVQIGEFAADEEREEAARRLSHKQQSAAPTESTSDVVERNSPMQLATAEDATDAEVAADAEAKADEDLDKQGRCSSTDDESERHSAEEMNQDSQQVKARSPRPEDDEEVCDSLFDKLETRGDRALSAPLTPVLHVKTRPVSMSLSTANMKRVVFESSGGELDASGRGSCGSDYASTPERHYFGQIKQCLVGINDIIESSRNLEVRIVEKQVGSESEGAPCK